MRFLKGHIEDVPLPDSTVDVVISNCVIAIQTQGRRKKASVMNEELHKQKVYGQIVWRNVQVWLDVRNDAAHGDWGKYTEPEAKLMIAGIRVFVGQHPA